MGEVFAPPFVQQLTEYQILLTIACLVYEPKEMNKFKQPFRNEELNRLRSLLQKNEYLYREKKFLELDDMTTLINPIYNGKSFFEVMAFTNLLEGDLIRFFGQILDRIGQIRKASTDHLLRNKMENCRGIIEKALEGIYLV